MKQSEKIISGLQQDIVLPDIVLQKADDAFSRILAENEKGKQPAASQGRGKNSRHKKRKRFPVWARGLTAAAAVLIAAFGICAANPVMAAKIPIIGHLFSLLQDKISFSGDYTGYAEPLDGNVQTDPETGGDSSVTGNRGTSSYSQTVNGVTVTLSEVYCNQEALNISLIIEGNEDFQDKIMTNQFGKQSLFLDMDTDFSFRDTPVMAGSGNIEGSFLDARTYAGVWRLDLKDVLFDVSEIDRMTSEAEAKGEEFVVNQEVLDKYGKMLTLPDEFTLNIDLKRIEGMLANPPEIDWGMSKEELEALSDEDFQALHDRIFEKYGLNKQPNTMQHYWFEGPWTFTLPIKVNTANNRTISVNDVNEAGIGLESVTVTPFEIHINEVYLNHDKADYFPVVLDAQGKYIDSAGSDAAFLPVADHDISRITVYLCDYLEYMDELKGLKYEDNFRELLEERAVYKKEVVLE